MEPLEISRLFLDYSPSVAAVMTMLAPSLRYSGIVAVLAITSVQSRHGLDIGDNNYYN